MSQKYFKNAFRSLIYLIILFYYLDKTYFGLFPVSDKYVSLKTAGKKWKNKQYNK